MHPPSSDAESLVCQLLAWERRVLERQVGAPPNAPDTTGLPLVSNGVRRARLQDIVGQQQQLGCFGVAVPMPRTGSAASVRLAGAHDADPQTHR